MPQADDDEQAERVYSSIAEFVDAPVPKDHNKRIWKLSRKHNGMDMECEVGQSLPSYYRTGDEPVLAILDAVSCYKICTSQRGGTRGEPVLAGKRWDTYSVFFENSGDPDPNEH